ncbi:PaaI family thioesterase [Mycobacterium sp. RTGN5]|uniref:PaaI family thioesterase n=1 Tax=Mycobacterium sp. RTGN5 TaxID=3016522 RepID=UPI0029C76DEF|nr:PaaI family thioesterase [Mycobacterium sp. RTGN5]
MTEAAFSETSKRPPGLGPDEPHLFDSLPFRDVTISDSLFVVDLDNAPALSNSHGALQGGLVATLIDVAAGRLALANTGTGQAVATSDMTVHYLAPIRQGPARASATVVRKGKRLIVVAVDVTDVGGERRAARATLSFAVLDPR